jgi:hypothetical protein
MNDLVRNQRRRGEQKVSDFTLVGLPADLLCEIPFDRHRAEEIVLRKEQLFVPGRFKPRASPGPAMIELILVAVENPGVL